MPKLQTQLLSPALQLHKEGNNPGSGTNIMINTEMD